MKKIPAVSTKGACTVTSNFSSSSMLVYNFEWMNLLRNEKQPKNVKPLVEKHQISEKVPISKQDGNVSSCEYRVSTLVWRNKRKENKTRTSKVGAISKAQKAQNFFLEKNLKFLIFFFRKLSHSAEKCKRGTILIYKHTFCCEITKNSDGGPFGDIKKFFEKKSHNAEKNRKRDSLVPSGFVG